MTLTTQQVIAVQSGEPVHLVPEEVGEEVVLIRGDLFKHIAALFDDWDPQVMGQGMAKLMEEDWNDSAMSVYDE
jgi:hypothetical protein